MNEDQAYDAVCQLLQVHAREFPTYRDIDVAVSTPEDEALRKAYDIEFGSAHEKRQLAIARQSFTPLLRLMLNTYSQSLKVDNYFQSEDGSEGRTQSAAWQHWQRNRMDARQTGINHAALKYGKAYASVLPSNLGAPTGFSDSAPRSSVIDTFNPKRMTALYSGAWDFEEYPVLALQHVADGFRLFDERNVYYFGVEAAPRSAEQWLSRQFIAKDNFKLKETKAHNIGVVPIVRYRDQWLTQGEESNGIVEPLIEMANRINLNNFQEGVSRHWAAFKQRYVAGWVPEDEIEALNQTAAELWWFESNEIKVGQFDETDLSQYTGSRQFMEQSFAAAGQLSATTLGASSISNVSAEGLAALERAKEGHTSEVQTALGESYEQMFRLCSHVAGESEASSDFGAEVHWKDTSAKTLAQTVDALGKIATQLGVPVQELWSDIPGWTSQRVERAKEAFDSNAIFSEMGDFASASAGIDGASLDDVSVDDVVGAGA